MRISLWARTRKEQSEVVGFGLSSFSCELAEDKLTWLIVGL